MEPGSSLHISNINTVHGFPPYLSYILLIYSHLHPGLSSGLLPSGFSTKTLQTFFLFPIRATLLIISHTFITPALTVRWRKQFIRFLFVQFLQHLIPSSLLRPSVIRGSLFWNAASKGTYHHHHHRHRIICLTTGPKPLPKSFPHRGRSSASSFSLQYSLFYLRSSSSCLSLLARLPVTDILLSTFPSINSFRRQFLCKMWLV